MMYGKKMILISPEEAERLKSPAVPQPVEPTPADPTRVEQSNSVAALDKEMQRILETPMTSDFDKWTLYKQVLQKFVNKLREERKTTETEHDDDIDNPEGSKSAVNHTPPERVERLKKREVTDVETYNRLLADSFSTVHARTRARVLLNLLKRNRELQWDSVGQVTINGVLNESNLDALIRAAVSTSSKRPAGWRRFSKVLERMSIPSFYAPRADNRNKGRGSKIKTQQDEKAKLRKWTPY